MDNATPSANSTAAAALQRLAALTGRDDLAEHAGAIIRLLGSRAARSALAFGNLLGAIELDVVGITEVVVCGDRADLVRGEPLGQ